MSAIKPIHLGSGLVYEPLWEPKSQSEILFHDKQRPDQFWRRDNSFPQIFFDVHPGLQQSQLYADKTVYDDNTGELLRVSVADTELVARLLDQEMHRRIHGVYFMNDGELSFLTGGNYFMLQWGAMPGVQNPNDDYASPYGEYRDFQARTHMFLDLCKLDPECGGGFIGKAKKTGITQLISIDYANESTMMKDSNFGMMSKTEPDCIRANFAYFLFTLKRLPNVFKPSIQHDTTKKIIFDEAKVRGSSRNAVLRRMQQESGFGTEVFVAATVADGFDGPKMTRAWLDEFPKYSKPDNPEKVFSKTSETVKMGQKITGKLWISSYSPEEDSKEVEEAAKVWEDSKEKDSRLGRTPSGLYTHFISAIDSGEGMFDRYGRCDTQKTRVWIAGNKAAKADNPAGLLAFSRQYPEVEEEMWTPGGGGQSVFDNVRLGKQKIALEAEQKVSVPFEYGRLEWTGEEFKSAVQLIPLTDAERLAGKTTKWEFYGREYWDSGRLNYPIHAAAMRPEWQMFYLEPYSFRDTWAGGAWDPADFAGSEDVQDGSNHAGLIESIFDIPMNTYHGKLVTGNIIAAYHGRSINPEDDFREWAKAAVYFGISFYMEYNKPWMTTLIKKHGLERFLTVREGKTGGLVQYDPKRHFKFPTTTQEVIDNYCKAIATRIAPPSSSQDIDWLAHLKVLRVITQLIKFKTKQTKRFDDAVAYGLLRVLMDSISLYRSQALRNRGSGQKNSGIGAAVKFVLNGI